MNNLEKKAFIEAFVNIVDGCGETKASQFIEAYLSNDIKGLSTIELSKYLDALGMWHSAIKYQLTQERTK